MFRIFKPKHKCDWELVATNDTYHTEYTDTNRKVYHEMRFYQCSCGKRRYTSDYDSRYSTHKGMEKAKKNWLDSGVVPATSAHPSANKNYVKAVDIKTKELDPVLAYQQTLEEMVKTLGVVINRDFDLEARYPELKKAADEYYRRLEKYRNFESLKK